MKSTNLYGDHLASLLKFCDDFKDALFTATGAAWNTVDFDAYETDEDFPAGNLIGPAGYAIDIDEHLLTITVMIGVATDADLNHFRLKGAMNVLVQRLLPTKRIDVVDAEEGEKLGTMTINNGVRAMPTSGGLGRPIKWVAMMLSSDVTADLGGI